MSNGEFADLIRVRKWVYAACQTLQLRPAPLGPIGKSVFASPDRFIGRAHRRCGRIPRRVGAYCRNFVVQQSWLPRLTGIIFRAQARDIIFPCQFRAGSVLSTSSFYCARQIRNQTWCGMRQFRPSLPNSAPIRAEGRQGLLLSGVRHRPLRAACCP